MEEKKKFDHPISTKSKLWKCIVHRFFLMIQQAVPALITAFIYLLLIHLSYFWHLPMFLCWFGPLLICHRTAACVCFSLILESVNVGSGFWKIKNKPQKMLESLRFQLSSLCPIAIKAHWSPSSEFPPQGVCFLTPAFFIGTVHLNIKCVYVVPDFSLYILN